MLVLGSTLGALVAGSFLAKAGLRVVLLEEEVHAKRPPVLREPFLLTGLESGGPADAVLRELAISLLERRELVSDDLAFQLLLPGARIDVGRGRAALARELAAYGLSEEDPARSWLEAVDQLGDAVRAQLIEALPEEPSRFPIGAGRRASAPEIGSFPELPTELGPFADAWLSGLAPLDGRPSPQAMALLMRGARDGAMSGPNAGRGFLDLLRRRFVTLHGEVRSVERFGLVSERQEVGVELAREVLFARALIVAVPRAPLARVVGEVGDAPRWLLEGPPVDRAPRRILRAESDALPVGMAARVICSGDDAGGRPWSLTRAADPEDSRIEWLLASGHAVGDGGADSALGKLTPFSEGRIVAVDAGPDPRWDLDGVDLRFSELRSPTQLKRRPLIVGAGPEIAPELGFEGEVLFARHTAQRVVRALS